MATLLGEWGFLDNLEDTSGNDRHAVATGTGFTPTYSAGPQAGTRALVLNSVPASVVYGRTGLEPVAADGGIVTMVWAKMNSIPNGYVNLLTKMRGADSTRHAIRVDSAGKIWYMARWKNRLSFAAVGILPISAWFHVCLVDADDRYSVYINGTEVATGGAATGTLEGWTDYPWRTGPTDPDASLMTSAVDMAVSGARLFSGTMTAAQVTAWKDTPITDEPEPPAATRWIKTPAGGVKVVEAMYMKTSGGLAVPVSDIFIR